MEHIPAGGWSWRGSATVFVLVAAPEVALLGLSPEARTVSVVAAVGALVTYCVVLLTGLLVYLQYRLAGGQISAWITAILAVAAVQGISWAGLRLARPDEAGVTSVWQMTTDLACTSGLLAMLLMAQRFRLRRDPMALGIMLGVAVGAVRVVLVAQAAPEQMSPGVLLALNLVLLAVYLVTAFFTARLPELPRWVSSRLALSVVLLSLGQFLANLPPAANSLSALTVVLDPLGAVLLCATALAWLRLSIRDNQRVITQLSDHVHAVEAGIQADRERLHEITGTIAGIASASRLIHREPLLPEQQVRELQRMVESEVERLERLMSRRSPDPVRCVDLDETIQPVVTVHRVLGETVSWQPSGLRVRVRADDVAEVLNILLNNAAQHAPGSATTVTAEQRGDTVRVSVSDSGPGVSPQLRPNIFEWEQRSPSSSGQGIGLAIARRLLHEQGGSLALLDAGSRGSTFTMELPAGGRDERATS